MSIAEFKKIVKKAVSNLISDEHFADAASRNWTDAQGNEEELYPYFTEMIRRQLKCEVRGIGWGKYNVIQ